MLSLEWLREWYEPALMHQMAIPFLGIIVVMLGISQFREVGSGVGR